MAIEDSFSPLVKALVDDPDHVPDVYLVQGLLGRSDRDGYVRLYLPADGPPGSTRFLDKWIDIDEHIVRSVLALAPEPAVPSGWNAVWIDATAAAGLKSPIVFSGGSVDPDKLGSLAPRQPEVVAGKPPRTVVEPGPAAVADRPDGKPSDGGPGRDGGEGPSGPGPKFPPGSGWPGFPPRR